MSSDRSWIVLCDIDFPFGLCFLLTLVVLEPDAQVVVFHVDPQSTKEIAATEVLVGWRRLGSDNATLQGSKP